jgi:hypothetical protein
MIGFLATLKLCLYSGRSCFASSDCEPCHLFVISSSSALVTDVLLYSVLVYSCTRVLVYSTCFRDHAVNTRTIIWCLIHLTKWTLL